MNGTYKFIFLLCLIACSLSYLAAEDGDAFTFSSTSQSLLAMSTPDYLVTPGDLYRIGFFAGTNEISYSFIVDSSYRIRVEPYAIVAGNPAKVIKYRFEKELRESLINIDIVELFDGFKASEVDYIYSSLNNEVLQKLLKR